MPYDVQRYVARNAGSLAARIAKRKLGQYGARLASVAASRFRFPGYKRNYARQNAKYIKRIINGQKETHHTNYSWGKFELYHNQFTGTFSTILNSTAILPSQGDGDSNRTGNDILARGIQLQMMFGFKQDRHNTTFRVVVFKCTKGMSVASYTNIFDNATNNVMLDPVDKDRVTVVMDKKVKAGQINPSPDGKEITIFRKWWIPHKATYKFYDDGAQDNSYPYDYRIVVMAYDAYGTLQTDNIGYIQTWSRFYFKDK